MDKQNGFSMLELIIVIGIIAILASLITPLALNYITQKRYEACNEELKIIKQAIVGDSTIIEGGTRSSFGFVGDLGRLPNSLDELINQGTLPSWGLVSNVYFGWRGPYISEYTDPWGNNYQYSQSYTWPSAGTANPLFQTLPLTLVTISSLGQDISDSSDDVSITIRADEAYSMISGNTLDECGAGTAFTGIQLSYPVMTSIIGTTLLNTTIGTPHYNITTAIPIGIRYISVGNPTQSKFIYINNGPLTIVNLRTQGPCN